MISGTAWDNYNLNLKTLGGKNNLHVTVGIVYQNITESIVEITESNNKNNINETGPHQPRRRFDGPFKTIPLFHVNLKSAKFDFDIDTSEKQDGLYTFKEANNLDIIWLITSIYNYIPMFNGFFSDFVEDPLSLTGVAHLDPISQPPMRNDVVTTMNRSLKIAEEREMIYHPVTYDLAVALKAYCIQVLELTKFDNLIILLGPFHIELAFFGGVGTFIADSSLEYPMIESGILAEGSLNGFIKGKFCHRCTRFHQIIANTLEKMLFERFLSETECTEKFVDIIDMMKTNPDNGRLLEISQQEDLYIS